MVDEPWTIGDMVWMNTYGLVQIVDITSEKYVVRIEASRRSARLNKNGYIPQTFDKNIWRKKNAGLIRSMTICNE